MKNVTQYYAVFGFKFGIFLFTSNVHHTMFACRPVNWWIVDGIMVTAVSAAAAGSHGNVPSHRIWLWTADCTVFHFTLFLFFSSNTSAWVANSSCETIISVTCVKFSILNLLFHSVPNSLIILHIMFDWCKTICYFIILDVRYARIIICLNISK